MPSFALLRSRATGGSSVHFLRFVMARDKSTAHFVGATAGSGGEGHESEGSVCNTPCYETRKKVINKWLGAITSLEQKTEFKNKVSDSNYREINLNFLFEWNSKFWFSFDENLFFLTLRCNQELASQISSKSKVLEIFSEFLSKFNS
jgi:hypothetical protein